MFIKFNWQAKFLKPQSLAEQDNEQADTIVTV